MVDVEAVPVDLLVDGCVIWNDLTSLPGCADHGPVIYASNST